MSSDSVALDECRRHLRYLRAVAARVPWPLAAERMEAPDDDLVAAHDQFAFRFARLQDTLGQRVLRAVLVARLREPYEDRLGRALGGTARDAQFIGPRLP